MICRNLPVFLPHEGCPHRCLFCDQNTISGAAKAPSPAQVEVFLRGALDTLRGDLSHTQIAYFGGSFTCMEREYQRALLELAARLKTEYGLDGVRCSTRPDGMDETEIEFLSRYPLRAVELGAQSMDENVLRLSRRGHTAEDTKEAAARIHAAGWELGVQMMVGLPGDSEETVWHTARELAALNPATVRIYPTAILTTTPAYALWKAGKYPTFSLEEAVELCAGLLEYFETRGVRVIKCGLHASREAEERLAGGIYHPAFRELCESRLYQRRLLSQMSRFQEKRFTVRVNPRDLSRAIGQKQENLRRLSAAGYEVRMRADETVKQGRLRLLPEPSRKDGQEIAVKITGASGL